MPDVTVTVNETTQAVAVDVQEARDGSAVYVQSGAPSDTLGNDGDIYIRTDTSDIYKKAAGAWGSAVFNFSTGSIGTGTTTVLDGLLKGDGANLAVAVAGTDYLAPGGAVQPANNLSDLDSAATARTNLGLGTAATTASGDYATAAQGTKADTALQAASNLSDVSNAATARTNLGLGTAATTASGDYATAAQGTKADTALQGASNLSDLDSAATARTNLDVDQAGTAVPNYLGPVTLTSATSIAWDVDNGTSANLADLAHDATVTLSNLADGEEFSLAGTQDGTGGRALTIAHSGLTVRGDTSGIAGLTAEDAFVVVGRRVGTDLLLSVQTYEIT